LLKLKSFALPPTTPAGFVYLVPNPLDDQGNPLVVPNVLLAVAYKIDAVFDEYLVLSGEVDGWVGFVYLEPKPLDDQEYAPINGEVVLATDK
jgi:hypothetical protein